MSFYCHLLALVIIALSRSQRWKAVHLFFLHPILLPLLLFSSPTPSPLHVLRASLWNMAGRKESTIGVLSSDRCPCCAFSSHCEQALGRQPHKTWKNLTCVQNSSSCRSLKQTRTHAGTTSCRHITRTQTRFPFRLPGTCLEKVNTRSSHYWHIECNVGFCYTALCETRKKSTVSYSFAASLPARRIDELL